MKKYLLFVLGCVLLLLLVAYGLKSQETRHPKTPLRVSTTFYPLWYMTRRIAKDRIVFTNLAEGVDVHSYKLTPQDLVNLFDSDLLIYQGAGLEPWIDDVIPELEKEGITVVGFTQDINRDPHIWLDPVFAQDMVAFIKDSLITIDPDGAVEYEANALVLTQEFVDLDNRFVDGLSQCTVTGVVVSHDAFGYLSKRYHFTTYTIAGISTEDQPSAKTLAQIKEKTQVGVTHILVEESSTLRFAQVIADETGLTMLSINPLGRGTLDESKDFFDVMNDNLGAFEIALGCKK